MMKKTVKFILVSVVSILLASCASSPETTSYVKLPETPVNYGVEIDQLDISIGVLKDNEICSQMQDIIGSLVSQQLPLSEYDEVLQLEVIITQRPYYKGIDQYNSIYMNYKLVSEDETVVLNNCYFNTLTDSIESSKIQYELSKNVVNEVCKFINASKTESKKESKKNK